MAWEPRSGLTHSAAPSRARGYRWKTNQRRSRVGDHSSISWPNHMTDAGGGAVGRIEGLAALAECSEVGAERFEFGDAVGQRGGVLVDEREHVGARGLAAFTELDDLADLAQGESDGLRGAGERESVERVRFVGSVPVGFAGGGGHDADAFVVVEGLDRHARATSGFTDAHGAES